ncbi:E3 ubiquitin-protein ligase listerin, partial [Lecanoromycetidae sp. Uapishka_2]
MSKKPFKSQASSSRAVSGAFGGASDGFNFGSKAGPSSFGAVASSPLSYVYEPPDLSGFSEPIVGVAFKNLQKKDGTTKSKALEELQTYVASLETDKGGLEDAVLEAWGAAWNTYLEISELVQAALPEAADKDHFYKTSILPILTQYIRPSLEQSRWTVAAKLMEDVKTSLPEQSKEYHRSQDSVAAETDRWYRLQAALLSDGSAELFRPILPKSTPAELVSALSVLKARNGKPYGAANSMDNALRQVPDILLGDVATKETLIDFMNNVVPNILLSPSAKSLVRLIDLLWDKIDVSEGHNKCVQSLTEAPDSALRSIALQGFVASPHLATTQALFPIVMGSLRQAMEHDGEDVRWGLVMAAVSNSAAPKDLTDDILGHLTEGLSIDSQTPAGLDGLKMVLEQDEGRVRSFALTSRGSSLLSKLLLLSDSPVEKLSQRAKHSCKLLERALATEGDKDQTTKSMIEIIQKGFTNATDDSLSQAQKLLEKASSLDMPATAEQLLPSLEQWSVALHPFITRSPNASLAITNSFGGALYLIPPASSMTEQAVPRDSDGYSSAFRMIQYTMKLIRGTLIFDGLSSTQRTVLCKNIALFIQLAGDDLSVPSLVALWDLTNLDTESEISDVVAEAQTLLASWLYTAPLPTFVSEAEAQLLHESSGISTASYYTARAYSVMAIEITEVHGIRGIEDEETKRLRELRRSPQDIFAAAATFTSICESKELLRLCNAILADLTGQDLRKPADEDLALRQLVMLNSLLYRPEKYVDEVPKQRLVFFVKHVVQQLQGASTARPGIAAETMRALFAVLPAIGDIYGSFWEELLELIPKAWMQASSDENTYRISSSLRLLSLLRRSDMQQSNDDLLDAWAEKKGPIAKGLVGLMVDVHNIPDESHQPRRIVNELAGRHVASLSKVVDIEVQDLYPVLASESAALQHAAYELLHAYIPTAQEQVSLDKALSKDYIAQLPQELLSLILAPPPMGTLAEHNFERTMAPSLRSYLLSWRLTFDHWQNASYKVQGDYVAALKEGTYLQDFLSFALNILITARTRPIDASKFDIENYAPNTEESPERETHWLLINLYYLSLRFLPTLSKEWWRDTASRQLNIALEPWTEKYISPLIIARELSTIAAWAPSQAADDQPMTIKTSLSTREITASIPIDEQTMSISVRLPPSYPLARAEVKSIHRVGVVEKKWQSWLMISQGVMNLSSGSAGEGNALIDGLIAWRKNVSAAMKGQAECAICYSVVSGAKELPSKRCSTCKNSFHSSCLFRWFKSSNSSSCPLCRNAFHYS